MRDTGALEDGDEHLLQFLDMVRAVFFDLGETLLNFGRVDHSAAFREGAKLAHEHLIKMGQPVGDFGAFHRTQRRAIVRAYRWSLICRRDFNALDTMAKTHRDMGLTTRPEDLQRLALLFYEPIRRLGRPEPDVHNVLRWLREHGCRLAVVSNTWVPGIALDDHLAREGLLEFFRDRVYSCDTRYRKPHPRIYQVASERVGVPAAETMFVGDTLRTDIRGANRVGMISVWKAPRGCTSCGWTRPRYTISELRELPELVLRHERGEVGSVRPG